MFKKYLKPDVALYPVPVVMVSCGYKNRDNIITLAWIGTLCSEPPIIGISVRPERYSYSLIKESKDFVVNIPNKELIYEVDYCGGVSGREIDKFKATNLTKEKAKLVYPPLIKECPINIECKVIKEIELGTHTLFLGKVVSVDVDEELIDNSENISYEKIKKIVYTSGKYLEVGNVINHHGFSIK